MTREYNEAWAYEQKERLAQPDYTPVLGLDGKTTFTRTRPIRCPWCRDIFFAYQPDERPLAPYENPEPQLVGGEVRGQRETCGHPKCWDIEQRHQMQRQESYTRAAGDHYGPKEEAPVKVVKKKGLQKLGAAG